MCTYSLQLGKHNEQNLNYLNLSETIIIIYSICSCCTAVEEFEIKTHACLNFQNGDIVGVVRCITVSIVNDTKVENDEHFNFSLTNGQGTQFNESSIEIYIIEDDGMLINILCVHAYNDSK